MQKEVVREATSFSFSERNFISNFFVSKKCRQKKGDPPGYLRMALGRPV
jgi:hypothetical protein